VRPRARLGTAWLRATLPVALAACSSQQAPEPASIVLSVLPPPAAAASSSSGAGVPVAAPKPEASRFGVVAQTGHASGVRAVAYSPDGRFLATGGFDQTVRIWDDEGRLIVTFTGHREAVTTLAWSPSSAELASGANDDTVRIWDLRTTKLRATLEKAGNQVAWSPDGELLATCGYSPVLKVWDARRATLVRSTKAKDRQLTAVAWSPDGQTLATGGLDGGIATWVRDTLAPRTSERVAGPSIWALAYNHAGTRLAAANGDRIHVLDPRTGKEVSKAPAKGATIIAWRPDGAALATWVRGKGIQVYDPDTAASRGALKGPGWAVALAYSPDGRRLAEGGGGAFPNLSVWDSALTKRLLAPGHDARVEEHAGWSPSGDLLAAAGESGGVEVWDLRAGRLRSVLGAGREDSEGFSWSPDGKLLATFGRREASVFEVASGAKLGALEVANPQDFGFHLAWTRDGGTLFVGLDREIFRWDAASRTQKPAIKLQGYVSSIVASPDGVTLAVTLDSGASVELWALPAARAYATIKPNNMGWSEPPAWSPDSATLATATGDTIELWNAKTGQAVASQPGHKPFAAPVFSPDGAKLAFSTADEALMIWDVPATTTSLLRGHDDIVRQVAWSPSGRELASSADDGTVRIWASAGAAPRATFPGHAGRVWRVAWHPSGAAVASACLEARVNRVSDGAALVLRSFRVGAKTVGVIHTDDGLFVGDAEALDQLWLREGTDLRTAKLSTARELRGVLERPSLVADFWSNKPLE
jgi:WD40 repeat protein